MRTITRLVVAVAAAAPLALTPAVASAATATTYHGIFTRVSFQGCGDASLPTSTSGTWNVQVSGRGTYVATFTIFLDDRHHVSYAAKGTDAQVVPGGFSFGFETLAGWLDVGYDGTTLTYDFDRPNDQGIAYSLGDLSCQRVTYFGR